MKNRNWSKNHPVRLNFHVVPMQFDRFRLPQRSQRTHFYYTNNSFAENDYSPHGKRHRFMSLRSGNEEPSTVSTAHTVFQLPKYFVYRAGAKNLVEERHQTFSSRVPNSTDSSILGTIWYDFDDKRKKKYKNKTNYFSFFEIKRKIKAKQF